MSSPKKSNQQAFEARVDDLERRLKEKMEVGAGFADIEVRARKLIKLFRHFDVDDSGVISYPEFFASMTKLNFVGCQREIEGLFNRYDDDASGSIDYSEFALHVFGVSSKSKFDDKTKDIVKRVQAAILDKGGVSGLHGAARLIRRMDIDGSNSLDKRELADGLRHFYAISDVSPTDMNKLFSYFDRDGSGRISVEEFLRGLKTGMSYERKQLVRQAFDRLDPNGSGVITTDEILATYDTSTHPDVASGLKNASDVAEEILGQFRNGGTPGGTVTWPEFLDYYKGLSVGIDDDSYFELMIRNAWHLAGGDSMSANTTCRRVLVVHTDGSQEVVEIKDDFGLGKFDTENIGKRLLSQGVRNIASIKI